MIKINRKFISLYNYFIDKKAASFDNNFSKNQILGAIQPLVSMVHDAQYLIKGYRSFLDFLYEALQPFRGIKNFIAGAASIFISICFLLFQAVSYPFSANKKESYSTHLKNNFLLSLSWMINGLALCLRGLTQFFATPLTWFVKIPLRASITEHFGAPKIEENEEIEYLVNLAEKQHENMHIELNSTLKDLHKEFLHNLNNHQETKINSKDEAQFYKVLSKANYTDNFATENYIGLFKNRMNPHTPDKNSPNPQFNL
ncbi:MAG: hypothetical protein LCH30_06675 [Proteobacteria bacterium]|nr:hypothetical protein [Pseudomonadota bacterium]